MKHGKMVIAVAMVFIAACPIAKTQYLDRYEAATVSINTGDLRTDLLMMPDARSFVSELDSSYSTRHANRYSPMRAALYSAVIPGAGQFYTKSYVQSALFVGAEAALWILYFKYENKGDQQTQDFQNYADQNYSVVRYVQWIQKYYPAYYAAAIQNYGSILNGSTSPNPWDQVNWSALNQCETLIGNNPDNIITGFSHQLPIRPQQQYYELIGKYPQFAGGWDDAAASGIDANAVVAQEVSPHFLYYRNMRGDANSYYNIASTMSYLLVANHVLNMLEAAWNAAHLNSKLHASSGVQPRNIDGYRTELAYTMNLQVEF
ncbi:MAG TPA: DUF5683 domain-containing protein [Bacteroidota bacterium]|nr:DUF5683 domain-containing protein [Bacteroidota bacterium]